MPTLARIIRALCVSALAVTLLQSAAFADTGVPPLVAAARDGRIATVRSLLAQGADPNAHGSDGISALEWAAAKGHVDEVTALLHAHAAVDAAYTPEQYTPLMRAANFGFPAVVSLLIAHGANVNARSIYGETALDFAIAQKHAAIVTLLERHGAVFAQRFFPAQFCAAGTSADFGAPVAWKPVPSSQAYYCQSVKHDFPGGAGEVVMYTYEVDGTRAFATSVYISTKVFMDSLPSDTIAKTLSPLLQTIFANAKKGAIPSDLLASLVALKNVRQTTPIGIVTGTYTPGTNASTPSMDAEYVVRIYLH